MAKPSWICTVATQLFLCFALFLVLNLGEPQKSIPNDFYFISVTGGYRPLQQQTHLLKLMNRVAKAYKPSFIVNVNEFGEDDPLTQNATGIFSSLKLPSYTTKASMQKIKTPHGKILEIIGLNTRSFQDLPAMKSSNGSISDRYLNLTQMLRDKTGDWSIVVGYEPLIDCKTNKEQIEVSPVYKPLHHIFIKFGVNMYLSRQSCANFARLGSVSYIGNPGLIEKKPFVASAQGGSVIKIAMADGFLLHRVTSLEIVTYFVNLAGEVVYTSGIQQGGKAAM